MHKWIKCKIQRSTNTDVQRLQNLKYPKTIKATISVNAKGRIHNSQILKKILHYLINRV